jgi:hypothetical protein
MGIGIRRTDISGIPFPPINYGSQANVSLQLRPPQFEPPDGATEFNLSFSASIPGGNVLTPLFTLDGNGNPLIPSAALQLPKNTVARINNVSIGGDTGAVAGTVTLVFSIRADRTGQSAIPGWEGIGLPGRGGVATVGFEPFTRILSPGSFFGGFVANLSGGPLYGEMIITGWYWNDA